MTTQTNDAPEPESTDTEYHYILTLQRPAPGGIEIATARGALNLTPGATRAEALDYAMGLISTDRGWPLGEGSILFFALEPNALTGGNR